MSDVRATYEAKRRHLDRDIGEARAIATQGKTLTEEAAKLEQQIARLDEAALVLQQFGERKQERLQEQIETLVTHGLQQIFGEELSFHILHKQQGKLAAMEFVIRSRAGTQIVETSIMDARGGGVAAVAGFLLRLLILLLKPNARPVLLLDETFAQLSEEYEPALAQFLRELVDKTPVQIIMVTHSDAYTEHADKAYRLRLQAGESIVTEVH